MQQSSATIVTYVEDPASQAHDSRTLVRRTTYVHSISLSLLLIVPNLGVCVYLSVDTAVERPGFRGIVPHSA
jgi:hypothetical protein